MSVQYYYIQKSGIKSKDTQICRTILKLTKSTSLSGERCLLTYILCLGKEALTWWAVSSLFSLYLLSQTSLEALLMNCTMRAGVHTLAVIRRNSVGIRDVLLLDIYFKSNPHVHHEFCDVFFLGHRDPIYAMLIFLLFQVLNFVF